MSEGGGGPKTVEIMLIAALIPWSCGHIEISIILWWFVQHYFISVSFIHHTQQHRFLQASTTAQGQQGTQQLLNVAQAWLLFLISVGHAILQSKLMVVKKCKQHAVTSWEDDLCGFIHCVITLVWTTSNAQQQHTPQSGWRCTEPFTCRRVFVSGAEGQRYMSCVSSVVSPFTPPWTPSLPASLLNRGL